MPKIVSLTRQTASLTPSERATMYGLLCHEFLGVSHHDFTADLEEKDAVVLLRREHSEGEIVGFSTVMLLDLPIAGRRVKAVFSGDTTVLEEFRSTGGIGIELGHYFLQTLRKFPKHEIYYVLICKGWRTYRVLPLFFHNFSPKPGSTLPEADKAVMDAFGRIKYPEDYDPEHGIIVFDRETQRLKPGSIDAAPPARRDEINEFFLAKNPTYLAGTELVCVAPVAEENFAAGMRKFLRLPRHRKESGV